jgi:hypothetical protein
MGDTSASADRRAAILQSCYIPWKGFFDIIAKVDVFVIYDDVQYSKNHWHNRNLIKTQHGLKWLTVPVFRMNGHANTIDATRVAHPFAAKHWRSIAQSYAKACFFKRYSERLEHCFKLAEGLENLSAINVLLLEFICGELDIRTEIVTSRDLKAKGTRTERLVNICQEVGANMYLSGPSATTYLDETKFADAGIGVEWMDYADYPSYPQLHGPFETRVTVLDLILNTGPDARRYLKFPARKPAMPSQSKLTAQGREIRLRSRPSSPRDQEALGRAPAVSDQREPRRISIIQSCYIPWKGFFNLIGRCDEYVIFDSAQYVKRHWHNRNRIKTASGIEWLTIPVVTKGRFEQPIDAVEIEKPWVDRHWRALELAYKRAAFFELLAPTVKAWYERADKETYLTDVNAIFLKGIAELLGLTMRIKRDTAYPSGGAKTERLLAIARAAGADRYLSGPSARAYFDEPMFEAAGIRTEWMSYEGYPEYPQLHGAFEHGVTALDLLFNTGPDAPRYLDPASPAIFAAAVGS